MLTVKWYQTGYGRVSLGSIPLFDVALSYGSNQALADAQKNLLESILELAGKTNQIKHMSHTLNERHAAVDTKPEQAESDMGKILQWT